MGLFKTTLRKPWLWVAQQLPNANRESNFIREGCCSQKMHFHSKCCSSTFWHLSGETGTLQCVAQVVHSGWFVYLIYIAIVYLSIATYFLWDIPECPICECWTQSNLNLAWPGAPKLGLVALVPVYISVYLCGPRLKKVLGILESFWRPQDWLLASSPITYSGFSLIYFRMSTTFLIWRVLVVLKVYITS